MSRYRHEYKYVINSQEEQILMICASGVLTRDDHVNEDGNYVIRSLYFDDYSDTCLNENRAGPDPRSKFRIRYYNGDTSRLRLEKKSKRKGMTLKESCTITQEECQTFMRGEVPQVHNKMDETKQKLFLEMQLRGLIPKVIVTYERIPFVYQAGNVRVTFDKNLTSSTDVSEFLTGNYTTRPIFPMGKSILEVKWDEIFPLHIKNVLKLESLQWTAFSKYAMCRIYHL